MARKKSAQEYNDYMKKVESRLDAEVERRVKIHDDAVSKSPSTAHQTYSANERYNLRNSIKNQATNEFWGIGSKVNWGGGSSGSPKVSPNTDPGARPDYDPRQEEAERRNRQGVRAKGKKTVAKAKPRLMLHQHIARGGRPSSDKYKV